MNDLVSVRIDTKQFDAGIDQLGRDAGKAFERAANRTLSNARTAMVAVIADDMGLAQNKVRPFLSEQKAVAAANRWTARLYASTKRVPLITFGARGPVPSRGQGGGVTARLPTGRERYPHAFIATMRSGHEGVFQRTGRRRTPIYELHGPSVYHVFQKHQSVAQARALEMYTTNLQHEFDFLLSQRAA